MAQSTILKAALEWAARGIPVFPCTHDKRPLTPNGHLNATTDPKQVTFLFEHATDDVLIGARMGADSGLFAIDFDLYKAGASEYLQYLTDKGLLDETQVHTTQSGGIHLIYKSTSKYPNCKPHIGVEVKGEGGYIIVPPSSGYAVERAGIRKASQDLIRELTLAQKASSKSTVDQLKRVVLSGQSFHDPLAQIAARRAAQGWSIDRVQKELLETLQASAASSPHHKRHERWKAVISDENQELSRIVGTGNDKYNHKAKTDFAKESVDDDTYRRLFDGGASIFSRSTLDDNTGPEIGRREVPDWGRTEWPFSGSGWESLSERHIFDQAYVAYPLFAERESVLIAAEPKVGKTAIALKLAMQVAYGESLGENFKVSCARPVLYFTLEGARAVEMRVRAELDDRKAQGKDLPERDMLFVVDRPHNFGEPVQRDANAAKIVLHNEMCKREWGVALGLIVIDTLTKAMPGRDQNSVEDTSELFELIGFLRAHDVTATIVFIHHLSKQGNVRGSTNIEAEVDVVLGVYKDKKAGLTFMDVRRARSMDEEVGYAFKFHSHYLGKTKQGHKLHAPIVRLIDAEVDTSGATAALAVKYAKAMDAIVALGVGEHDISELVYALAQVTDITPPSGKRPNFRTKSITDAINLITGNQKNWSYGDYILRVEYDGTYIVAIKILKAE